MLAPKSPGSLLRSLRVARGMSQESLAHRAEISTRHLSCLETGKARPSHAMLLVLGAAMDLPLRVRNNLLTAGGFAPVYGASPLDDPAMDRVRTALRHILRHQEPHPAFLLDRAWNVVQLNEGAVRLLDWCGVRLPSDRTPNALRVLFDETLGFRACVVDFERVADEALARVRTEADVDPQLRELVGELERLRGKPKPQPTSDAMPVALPLHLRRGSSELRYFTTLTTLGTPLDITAQELRIESYFPLDGATEAFGRGG